MSKKTDQMGYSLAPIRRIFTPLEIAAAKRLAKPRFAWDVVGCDPRVMGWRFLRDAAIVLRGFDPGEDSGVACRAEEARIKDERKGRSE